MLSYFINKRIMKPEALKRSFLNPKELLSGFPDWKRKKKKKQAFPSIVF